MEAPFLDPRRELVGVAVVDMCNPGSAINSPFPPFFLFLRPPALPFLLLISFLMILMATW